ncbi:MAG: alpha/beta hydrolase [bacterium]
MKAHYTILSMFFLIPLGLYCGLILFVRLFQSHFVYFPKREVWLTPGNSGLSYEEVYFTSADGIRLSGWFVPVKEARSVVLFCHGNAGNISHCIDTVQQYARLGLSSFLFDYRGYGKSDGKPSEQGTYRDAEAAWNYLVQKRNISSTEIIIIGRSLGGPIAAWLSRKHTPKGLVLESTFTTIRDIGAELYPCLPVKFITNLGYKTIEYIRQVDCPILIVHSNEDRMIPIDHGRKLFAAAHEPKDFLEISGTHNEGYFTSEKQYLKGLYSFITSRL